MNHICLYLICCTSGVLSNIGYFSQRKKKKKSERVEHKSSYSSGVKNVTSCAFFSNNWCNPPCPFFLFFFSFPLFVFVIVFLNFFLKKKTFYELDFTFHSTLKHIRNSISAIQNVEIESACIFLGDMMWVRVTHLRSLWFTAICCFFWELNVNAGLILSWLFFSQAVSFSVLQKQIIWCAWNGCTWEPVLC